MSMTGFTAFESQCAGLALGVSVYFCGAQLWEPGALAQDGSMDACRVA